MRRKADTDPLDAFEPTEAVLAQALERYLALTARLWYHTYDSRRSAPGFPDYVIIDGAGVLLLELKAKAGRLSPAQRIWVDELARAGSRVAVVYGLRGLGYFMRQHSENPAGACPAGSLRVWSAG